nr:leucine-rich repeat-containing protein 71-like isoform X2 [Geotrypetes seraphini]XP_033779514.1 leucine-rich repeat-containing protein 71-like isoform X2 [Geotrypetes seraphini]XP_033779515.1 leucine-rich repeat-containing protein 71-like isoform X2 [Geotrypetes seraphini]
MELCVALGIPEIPKVVHRIRHVTPLSEKTVSDEMERSVEKEPRIGQSQLHERFAYFQPRIHIDIENEDPKCLREIYIRAWKIDEKMMEVFSKCLPASQTLHTLNFWNVGLTDHTVDLLAKILPRCPNLKNLVLDGNPLPEQTYFRLLSVDSTLAHVTLRNNKIDNDGVWLIAQALQEQQLTKKNLVSLNLSYNHISDLGVSFLAKVLRMNRSLLSLSLAHNEIGDDGALYLAEVLSYFALSAEEIVQRRYLLLSRESQQHHRSPHSTRISEGKAEQHHHSQSFSGYNISEKYDKSEKLDKSQMSKSIKSASKKKEKEQTKREERMGSIHQISASGLGGPTKKEEGKLKKQVASSEQKLIRGKERKSATKDRAGTVPELELQDATEAVHPLLEPVEYRDGHIFVLGNRNLINLNLAMNKITERGLKGFVVTLESQSDALKNLRATHGCTGLLRLSLGRNNFSLDNPNFQKIQEVMVVRDPMLKVSAKDWFGLHWI